MSGILEAIGDAFFGVFNFFANLSVSRHDDPILAGWKRRKVACVVSTVIWAIVVVVLLVFANLLESIGGNSILGPMVDASRDTLGYVVAAVFGAASLYMMYAFYELWRFAKAEGMLDS